ncbi:hypothetical protein [Chryseobacterium sp. T20]|uniref:hypothetical protein n=1 Tax=Chryseobacterium sp. T20 TaxID=3395375 RepID=UPI0039BCB8F4
MEGLIQIVILVCLFIIIGLLAVDQVKIVKSGKTAEPKQDSFTLPDIMGRINKDMENPRLLENKTKRRMLMTGKIAKTDQSRAHIKNLESPVLVKELPSDPIEDEDFSIDDFPPFDDRFSQGVSLEELMIVGKLLQQNDLESHQENEVIDVMQKIQGTELYGLLEHSIGDASKKVAKLLDKNFKSNEFGEFDAQDSFDKFNIDDFI